MVFVLCKYFFVFVLQTYKEVNYFFGNRVEIVSDWSILN